MIKIIFVDDENNLLDALKRTLLRNKKDVWDMIFLNSGQQVLEELKIKKYDIIIADYKMPGMDGLELLLQIKDKYKEMKRIILTGQSEQEIFNKAKEVAHVYLSKPCNPDDLVSAIEKSSQNIK
jgi:DNA-binding NtrC family response regulator